MKRKENESYLTFVKRVTNAVECNIIDYPEWSESLLGQVRYSHETLRRCYQIVNAIVHELDNDINIEDGTNTTDLEELLEQIKAEKLKIQTANLEYNANARADARNEMFHEQLIRAINRLEPIHSKHIEVSPVVDAEGLLCLSDFHAGATYEVKGLMGEVVNKYDYDIMCDRLWRLIGMIESDDMVFDKLTVACLGDFFEGVLRQSSLVKLREPVTDTVIRFSEFFANWLKQLQDRIPIPINVVIVGGNHDTLRLLGQKPEFEGENLSKYVVEFLKLRLKDCPSITVDDYTDVAVKTIKRTNVMFEHGKDRDLATTLDYFSNVYNVDCDMIFAGHLHSVESKSVGIADVGDRMVYRVGSIIGIDPYAKSIRKGSRPSCFFGIFTDDGLGWQKNYYL